MDELLFDRVKQLREIDERLERMQNARAEHLHRAIRDLRNEVFAMIKAAEEAHASF